jgi:hypothetical protein
MNLKLLIPEDYSYLRMYVNAKFEIVDVDSDKAKKANCNIVNVDEIPVKEYERHFVVALRRTNHAYLRGMNLQQEDAFKLIQSVIPRHILNEIFEDRGDNAINLWYRLENYEDKENELLEILNKSSTIHPFYNPNSFLSYIKLYPNPLKSTTSDDTFGTFKDFVGNL